MKLLSLSVAFFLSYSITSSAQNIQHLSIEQRTEILVEIKNAVIDEVKKEYGLDISLHYVFFKEGLSYLEKGEKGHPMFVEEGYFPGNITYFYFRYTNFLDKHSCTGALVVRTNSGEPVESQVKCQKMN